MRSKYFKDEYYYNEQYDWHTVKECRDWVRRVVDKGVPEEVKSFSEKDKNKFANWITNISLFHIKGERYLRKEKTIQKWMDNAREKDEFVKNHPAPEKFCPKCSRQMELVIENLESDIDNSNLRMLFIYRCDSCKEKKGFYSNGEEYIFKNDFCPKCNSKWDYKRTKEIDKIIIKNHCFECGYKEDKTIDLSEKVAIGIAPDADFGKDRSKYCLNDKEGQEYHHYKEVDLPFMKKMVDGWEERDKNKDLYGKVAKLKKLNIVDLGKLLTKTLAKEDYIKFDLAKPEIGRDIIVNFTVQDSKSRESYDSEKALRKIFKESLTKTNWRLMSEGVSCRLGLLTGRLRGIDEEKALVDEIRRDRDKI